jgi:tetratricopeptide (TPR) repeat protein
MTGSSIAVTTSSRLQALQKAALEAPTSAIAHMNVGLELLSLNRFQDSLDALKTAARLDDSNADLFVSIAGAYNQLGQFGNAIAACKKALKIAPEHAGGHGNMGSAHRQLGEFEAAEKAFKTAIEIDPDSYGLHMNMAHLKSAIGDPSAALSEASIAVKLAPERADAHATLGEAYSQLGQCDFAVSAFQRAIKRDPKHVGAHLKLSASLASFGFPVEASSILLRALPFSNQNAQVLTELGSVLLTLGKIDKSKLAFRRAISQPHGGDEALMRLALFPQGLLDEEVINEIGQAFEGLPPEIKATIKLAFVKSGYLRHKGDIDAAFEVLTQANARAADERRNQIADEEQRRQTIVDRVSAWQPAETSASNSDLAPIFVLGPSRSGKSTLEQLLCASPEVTPCFEGKCAGGYRFGLSIQDKVSTEMQPLENGFSLRFQQHLVQQGARFGVYTNPHWSHGIDLAIDAIENARFIFVKRPTIDVAAEIFATNYRSGNHHSYEPHALMRYLAWYDRVIEVVAQKVPGKILTVTTEELGQNTTASLQKIAAHVGVDIETNKDLSARFLNSKSVFRDHFTALLDT